MTAHRLSTTRAWMLVAAIAGIAVYSGTLGHGFVFDDGIAIVRNQSIRSGAVIRRIFSETEWAGGGLQNHLYRPLTTLTYALNYRLGGFSAWHYHLTNVLLHGAVTLLVIRLGLRWRLPLAAAAFGGLLFAVHPIHVEAVANVVGRKDVLVTAFLLSMLLAHDRALTRGGLQLAFPPVLYALAMLSKEIGIVGIGTVFVHDRLFRLSASEEAGERGKSAALYTSYLVLLLGFLFLHRSVAGALDTAGISFIDNPAAHVSTGARVLTALALIGKGLGLLLLPINQSPDYSFDSVQLASLLDVRVLLGVGIGLGWLCLGLRLRRRLPAVLACWAWYALTILPGSNLLFPVGTIFGERLLYAPSVGFLLAAGFGLHVLFGQRFGRRGRVAVAGTLILFLSLLTVRYASAWESEVKLFTVAARRSHQSTKAHLLLAEALFREGKRDSALVHATRAVQIAPANDRARALAATILWEQGRRLDAAAALDSALAHTPDLAEAMYLRGRFAREQGDLERAAQYWRQAIRTDRNNAPALADLGTYYLYAGDSVAARSLLERSVLADPQQANAWFNLARLHRSQGRVADAIRSYRNFLDSAGRDYETMIPVAESELRALENL